MRLAWVWRLFLAPADLLLPPARGLIAIAAGAFYREGAQALRCCPGSPLRGFFARPCRLGVSMLGGVRVSLLVMLSPLLLAVAAVLMAALLV